MNKNIKIKPLQFFSIMILKLSKMHAHYHLFLNKNNRFPAFATANVNFEPNEGGLKLILKI